MTAWRPDLFPDFADARRGRPAKRPIVRAPGRTGSNPPWVRPARLPFILTWRAIAMEILLIVLGIAYFVTAIPRRSR